jgi:hypothetical protein
MLMKDNDCGVIKSNMAKKHELLKGIHHVNPETYRKLLWLSRLVKNSEADVRSFFQDEVLYTASDWANFKILLGEAVTYLKQECLSGSLHLDLNLDDVVKGRAPRDSRSFCENL